VQLILEIIIRVAEILTIVAGLAGILVSMVLLFSPAMIRKANRVLNKQMLTENQMTAFNPAICSEPFTLRHHIACGGLLVAGSIFILLFFFLGAPVPAGFGLFMDMAIYFSVLLGKTAGIVGFAAGALLFFSPGAFKAVGEKVNIWVDTEPAFNKLDTFSVDVDSIFIKYPLVCGLLGLVVSTALIVISIANFLGTSANFGGIS
jgi:hypothetical protein